MYQNRQKILNDHDNQCDNCGALGVGPDSKDLHVIRRESSALVLCALCRAHRMRTKDFPLAEEKGPAERSESSSEGRSAVSAIWRFMRRQM